MEPNKKTARLKLRPTRPLGKLAKKLVDLLRTSPSKTADLNEVISVLNVTEKRQLYDITDVLEGIGLIAKKSHGIIQWKCKADNVSNGFVEQNPIARIVQKVEEDDIDDSDGDLKTFLNYSDIPDVRCDYSWGNISPNIKIKEGNNQNTHNLNRRKSIQLRTSKLPEKQQCRTSKKEHRSRSYKVYPRNSSSQKVKILTGVRKCVLYHVEDGYFYKKNLIRNNSLYLVCEAKECNARGVAYGDLHGGIRLTSDHNHEPQKYKIEAEYAKRRILNRCENETTPIRQIFNEELTNVGDQVASYISYSSFVRTMQRKRSKNHPAIPTSLESFSEGLLNEPMCQTSDGTKMFSDLINGHTMLFLSPIMKSILKVKLATFIIDVTQKVVPRGVGAYQFLTIMAIYHDQVFPTAYALMSNKFKQSYSELFRVLKEKENWCPVNIIADFDASIHTAVGEVFPAANIVGSWFHYCQALRRRIARLGLTVPIRMNSNIARICRMLMGLPLLPPDRMLDGFRVIRKNIKDDDYIPALKTFVKYIDDLWMRGITPNRLSVYGLPRRMNNTQDIYHQAFVKSMGGGHCSSSDVWSFAEALYSLDQRYLQEYNSFMNGTGVIMNRKRLSFSRTDARLHNALKSFDLGQMKIKHFLEVISHSTPPLLETEDDVDGQEEWNLSECDEINNDDIRNNDEGEFDELESINEEAEAEEMEEDVETEDDNTSSEQEKEGDDEVEEIILFSEIS